MSDVFQMLHEIESMAGHGVSVVYQYLSICNI